MEIGEEVAAGVCFFWTCASFRITDLAGVLAHLLLARLVELHHASAGEMQRKSSGQQCQKSDLYGCVVDDLVLFALVLGVAVLELPSDCGVSGCDCDTTGQNTTSL